MSARCVKGNTGVGRYRKDCLRPVTEEIDGQPMCARHAAGHRQSVRRYEAFQATRTANQRKGAELLARVYTAMTGIAFESEVRLDKIGESYTQYVCVGLADFERLCAIAREAQR